MSNAVAELYDALDAEATLKFMRTLASKRRDGAKKSAHFPDKIFCEQHPLTASLIGVAGDVRGDYKDLVADAICGARRKTSFR